MLRSMALASVVGILLLPAGAICATPAPTKAMCGPGRVGRVLACRRTASGFALCFGDRRQAQAASGAGHAPAVPPSMQRTRRAISRSPAMSAPCNAGDVGKT